MAAYTGLATGAGAADGLEKLFARMRAEEALANQGRQIDIDAFEAGSMDTNRRGVLDLGNRNLGEDVRQFDAGAPGRDATTALNTASAREAGVRTEAGQESLAVLRGLKPYLGGADTSGGVSAPGATPDPEALNTPLGRIRLSAAGLEPNTAFGPPQVDNTDEEQYLTSYAVREMGPGKTGRDLTFDQRLAAMKLKPQAVIAQSNLDIRSSESNLRRQKQTLDIKSAEMQIQQNEAIPPHMRPFLLAEFRNRIQNDIQSSQTWNQWLNGESAPDPSAQIATIMADVLSRATTPPTAPGTAPATGAVNPNTPRRRFNRDGTPAN